MGCAIQIRKCPHEKFLIELFNSNCFTENERCRKTNTETEGHTNICTFKQQDFSLEFEDEMGEGRSKETLINAMKSDLVDLKNNH